jgi:predicted enzyme related to lactoylglutathione lyase
MAMSNFGPRLAGVELYFDDLEKARDFYATVLGLDLVEMEPGHHAKFDTAGGFVCLEKRGVEDYPSADKAVVFLEVADLRQTVDRIGADRLVKHETDGPRPWAVLHDPAGHNVMLLQVPNSGQA